MTAQVAFVLLAAFFVRPIFAEDIAPAPVPSGEQKAAPVAATKKPKTEEERKAEKERYSRETRQLLEEMFKPKSGKGRL